MTDQPATPPKSTGPAGDRIAKVLARAGVASTDRIALTCVFRGEFC